jgi:hypothetical protein
MDSLASTHRHCSNHREEILSSEKCGCFYCLEIYGPEKITEWCDPVDGVEQTALCPICKVDSVIGAQSGFPITKEFLEAMRTRWF